MYIKNITPVPNINPQLAYAGHTVYANFLPNAGVKPGETVEIKYELKDLLDNADFLRLTGMVGLSNHSMLASDSPTKEIKGATIRYGTANVDSDEYKSGTFIQYQDGMEIKGFESVASLAVVMDAGEYTMFRNLIANAEMYPTRYVFNATADGQGADITYPTGFNYDILYANSEIEVDGSLTYDDKVNPTVEYKSVFLFSGITSTDDIESLNPNNTPVILVETETVDGQPGIKVTMYVGDKIRIAKDAALFSASVVPAPPK